MSDRSRSRSPEPNRDNGGSGGGDGGSDEVKLYLGNLDYGKLNISQSSHDTEALDRSYFRSVFFHLDSY